MHACTSCSTHTILPCELHHAKDQYQPPPLPPVDFPKFTEKASFGADMKEKHFFLDVSELLSSLVSTYKLCMYFWTVLLLERMDLYQPWSFWCSNKGRTSGRNSYVNTILEELVTQICMQAWQKYCERQPVRFIDRELFPQLIHTVTRVARFIGMTLP